MKQSIPKILVVDDEEPIRRMLDALLCDAGYAVWTAASGEAALELLFERAFNVLLLDLKMVGLNGIEVAKRARAHFSDLEIIILTGQGTLDSAMDAIRADVFDYVLKTSEPEHILTRIGDALVHQRAQRSTQRVLSAFETVVNELTAAPPTDASASHEHYFSVGDLHISTWHQSVQRGDRTLTLTPTEIRIMACLAQRAGQVMTCQEIVQCAQGYHMNAVEAAELIKPHMYHLRQKLEDDPSNPQYILTVRGTGYLLKATVSSDVVALS